MQDLIRSMVGDGGSRPALAGLALARVRCAAAYVLLLAQIAVSTGGWPPVLLGRFGVVEEAYVGRLRVVLV